MFKKFLNLIIGDLEAKAEYKQMMKRVDALPEDYKYTFKKIQKYIYTIGGMSGDTTIFYDLSLFLDLVELFETSAADGRNVIDVIGSDVEKFSREFMTTYIDSSNTLGEKLNKEIMERFNKEEL